MMLEEEESERKEEILKRENNNKNPESTVGQNWARMFPTDNLGDDKPRGLFKNSVSWPVWFLFTMPCSQFLAMN